MHVSAKKLGLPIQTGIERPIKTKEMILNNA